MKSSRDTSREDFIKSLTNSTEQSLSWETNRSSASQDIPSILWNPKVHYCTCRLPRARSIQFMTGTQFSKIYFIIVLPSTPGSIKWSPFLRFPHQNLLHVLHVLPISIFLTWSPEWYLMRSTEHKAPCYVFFSTPLLPHPCWAQISSSAPYSRKPSAYIPPSILIIQQIKKKYNFINPNNFWNSSEMQAGFILL